MFAAGLSMLEAVNYNSMNTMLPSKKIKAISSILEIVEYRKNTAKSERAIIAISWIFCRVKAIKSSLMKIS